MGHGIFPNYGSQFVKGWQHLLSREERKAVFYPVRKSLKLTSGSSVKEEEEVSFNKGKKNKNK